MKTHNIDKNLKEFIKIYKNYFSCQQFWWSISLRGPEYESSALNESKNA